METKIIMSISELDELIEKHFEQDIAITQTPFEKTVLWWLYMIAKIILSTTKAVWGE